MSRLDNNSIAAVIKFAAPEALEENRIRLRAVVVEAANKAQSEMRRGRGGLLFVEGVPSAKCFAAAGASLCLNAPALAIVALHKHRGLGGVGRAHSRPVPFKLPAGAIAFFGQTLVCEADKGHDLEKELFLRYGAGDRILGDLWLYGQRKYWLNNRKSENVFRHPRIYLGIMAFFGDPSLRLQPIAPQIN